MKIILNNSIVIEKNEMRDSTMFYAETYLVTKKDSKYLTDQLHTFFQQYNDRFPFHRIYKRKLIFSAEHKNQTWNLLVIFEYEDEKHYAHFQHAFKDYRTQLVRQENMIPTPGSFFPSNQKIGLLHIVEHVNVQVEYLTEFKEIMIHNNGPAMEHIIEAKKWCQEFIALETTEVYYHNSEFPQWNQIHLIAMKLKGVLSYKKDFTEGLIKVNAPSFKENFGRLEEIRHFTSKTSARRVL